MENLEHGLFAVDTENRTIRGLLMPYGEESRVSITGTEPVYFERGSLEIPLDPSVVTLNREHDRFDPIGRATDLEDTDAGIVATFAIANTPQGDAYLNDKAEGKLKRLSAEVAEMTRDGARAIFARLTGAAVVTEGAFASAALFAIDPTVETENADFAPVTTTDHVVETYTDENGVQHQRDITVETTVDGNTKTITTTEVITEPDTTPAQPQGDNQMANDTATVPAQFRVAEVAEEPRQLTSNDLYAAITDAKRTGDTSKLEQLDRAGSLFALNDIKISGTNQVGTAVVQPAWAGELWQGRGFQRKVVPMLQSGALNSLEVKGWRWTTKPEVTTWAGNKANVPSNTPATESYTVGIQRFAGGHDIAREFYDFNVTEVIDSYMRCMVDSYAIQSDSYALTQLLSAAGAGTAAETYPSGVSGALGKIVQGALKVISSDATPSFAFVATDVYKELAYTTRNNTLEFLSIQLGLEAGQAESFKIIPHTGLANGNVLVGAREAATVLELPGSPIRVSAIDIARGGLDEAVFGYVGVKVDYPAALARIIPAA